MPSSPLQLLATLCSLILSACGTPPAPALQERTVGPCTWSYFGDPRAVAAGRSLFTGCVAPDGAPVVEAFDLATGRRRVSRPFGRLEPDDHNNPSLVRFHGRLFAFSSPHSTHARRNAPTHTAPSRRSFPAIVFSQADNAASRTKRLPRPHTSRPRTLPSRSRGASPACR